MSSFGGAGDGKSHRPVREGGERLGDADDRNARGVEDVAVGVRVDRPLEAGEQLVGAAVDGEAAVGARLPAGDSDRQDRRAGRDALDAAGPPWPTISPAICVPWRSSRVGSSG